ncbi:hypothetical protein UY3_15905 [Chelonia mydas]|uniref:Reverse transcriptase domain-containing protein n=1 Tax=Chelonia mydas TaxID=8469 RepID=M7BFI4_CHEMY|nr:hypothetical protein UY3_15905 [Chelonia mydas]
MEPAQLTAAVVSIVNTLCIILEYVQKRAKRRQHEDDCDEDMDTDIPESMGCGKWDIMAVVGLADTVESRFWAQQTSTDWWDHIVLQTNMATSLKPVTMQGTEFSRMKWKSINLMKKLMQTQADIFLSKCKQMDIMPKGLKNGFCGDPGNYRPVSITSVPGKWVKTIVRNSIIRYSKHHLLGKSQHQFCKGKSCFTKLLGFFEEVNNHVDEVIQSI